MQAESRGGAHIDVGWRGVVEDHPKHCPTSAAVTGFRCGSLIQWSPRGGCPGARMSMTLPTTPLRSMANPGCPRKSVLGRDPEKRVT